jgi:[ribosomal protein S5]-alanine N-acetyltransferase
VIVGAWLRRVGHRRRRDGNGVPALIMTRVSQPAHARSPMTVIRPLRLDDAQALSELYAANRAWLRPSEPERSADFYTLAGQRARAAEAIDGARTDRLYRFVILGSDDEIAGLIALENIVRSAAQSATVGYWVAESRAGHGLATRALAAAVAEAFDNLDLHRVQAPTVVGNRASQRVLTKNQFELIGCARDYLYVGGAWRDHLLFQRVSSSFVPVDGATPDRG